MNNQVDNKIIQQIDHSDRFPTTLFRYNNDIIMLMTHPDEQIIDQTYIQYNTKTKTYKLFTIYKNNNYYIDGKISQKMLSYLSNVKLIDNIITYSKIHFRVQGELATKCELLSNDLDNYIKSSNLCDYKKEQLNMYNIVPISKETYNKIIKSKYNHILPNLLPFISSDEFMIYFDDIDWGISDILNGNIKDIIIVYNTRIKKYFVLLHQTKKQSFYFQTDNKHFSNLVRIYVKYLSNNKWFSITKKLCYLNGKYSSMCQKYKNMLY